MVKFVVSDIELGDTWIEVLGYAYEGDIKLGCVFNEIFDKKNGKHSPCKFEVIGIESFRTKMDVLSEGTTGALMVEGKMNPKLVEDCVLSIGIHHE